MANLGAPRGSREKAVSASTDRSGERRSPQPPERKLISRDIPNNEMELLGRRTSTKEPEDDEVVSEPQETSTKSSKTMFIAIAAAVILVAVLLAVLLGGSKDSTPEEPSPEATPNTTDAPIEDGTVPSDQPQVDPEAKAKEDLMASWGAQDFTTDTNMKNDSDVEDAEVFIQDIDGLSLNSKYEVSSIDYVPTFVSYVKHRGSASAGMELYWLEADYKGHSYVVQVPFKYYKELDEVGIVPVKAEVLSIKGETSDLDRTIISYMSLDETTLKEILKKQVSS